MIVAKPEKTGVGPGKQCLNRFLGRSRQRGIRMQKQKNTSLSSECSVVQLYATSPFRADHSGSEGTGNLTRGICAAPIGNNHFIGTNSPCRRNGSGNARRFVQGGDDD